MSIPQARPDGCLVGLRFCNRHLRVVDQAGPSLIRQIHRRAQGAGDRREPGFRLRHEGAPEQLQERRKGSRSETPRLRLALQVGRKAGIPLQESLPGRESPSLLIERGEQRRERLQRTIFRGKGGEKFLVARQGGIRRRGLRDEIHGLEARTALAQFFQQGEAAPLVGRHIIDVLHVGVERDLPAQEIEHDRQDEESGQDDTPDCRGRIQMAVPVQAERPALLSGRRHEHGQENQDEQDGSRQHQRAHQTEIVQGTRFEQQQRQEGAHRGDVAHQQRIDLVGERLALVFLVFQMVHIVERIVHGDADDHRADAQDDDRDRTLEEREHAQRESRAEENRHTDPEYIGKAAERQPEHQTDKQQGDGDRQEAVFLDTGRILGCHQRTACRENVYAGAIGLHLR